MFNIYLLKSYYNELPIYKIGYTKRRVEDRIKDFKTGNVHDISIVHIFETDKYVNSIESTLHREYKFNRIRGEWFELSDIDIDTFIVKCKKLYENFKMLEETSTYLINKKLK